MASCLLLCLMIFVDVHDSENLVWFVDKCKLRFLAFNGIHMSAVCTFQILKRIGRLFVSARIRRFTERRENSGQ